MYHHEEEEILSEQDKQYIREKFRKEMKNVVPVKLYLGGDQCHYCDVVKKLLETFKELSEGKIELETFEIDEEAKEKLGVDRGPVIIIGKNEEVRYTGSPLGEEGWAFIETLIIASHGDHGIAKHVDELRSLSKKIRIETVITPSCPYCPYAALLANRIALASEGKVISDTVEAYEYPEIADKWGVTAVPTVILSIEKPYTGQVFKIGLPEEEELIHAILSLANPGERHDQ